MTDRYDRFTTQAREMLRLSLEEGQRFNHNHVGTEHLLLGILRMPDSIACTILIELGVTLDRVRAGVEFYLGRGNRMVAGEVGLTPRAKKVVELAIDEAKRLGSPTADTQHFLLGLIREGEGIACGVLESLGISLDTVRAKVVEKLQEQKSQKEPSP